LLATRALICGGGASRYDAVVDDDDASRELIGLVEVVRGQDDGLAGRGKGADGLDHSAARRHVHPHARLVEEQRVGVAADGQREVESLALAP
jgi:hypothetical protein